MSAGISGVGDREDIIKTVCSATQEGRVERQALCNHPGVQIEETPLFVMAMMWEDPSQVWVGLVPGRDPEVYKMCLHS